MIDPHIEDVIVKIISEHPCNCAPSIHNKLEKLGYKVTKKNLENMLGDLLQRSVIGCDLFHRQIVDFTFFIRQPPLSLFLNDKNDCKEM